MEERKSGEAGDRVGGGSERIAQPSRSAATGAAESERKEHAEAARSESARSHSPIDAMQTDESEAAPGHTDPADRHAALIQQLERAMDEHAAAEEEAGAIERRMAELQRQLAEAETTLQAGGRDRPTPARAAAASTGDGGTGSGAELQQAEGGARPASPRAPSPTAAARAGLWRLLQGDVSDDDSGDEAYEDEGGESSSSEDEFFDAREEEAAVTADAEAERAQELLRAARERRAPPIGAQGGGPAAGGAGAPADPFAEFADAAGRDRRRDDTDSEGSDAEEEEQGEEEEDAEDGEEEGEGEGHAEFVEERDDGDEFGEEDGAPLGAHHLAEMGVDIPAEDANDGAFIRFLRAMEGQLEGQGLHEDEGEDEEGGEEEPRPGNAEIAVARRIARLLRQAIEGGPAAAQHDVGRVERARREREEMAAAELARPVPPVDLRPVGILQSAMDPFHWFAGAHSEIESVRPRPSTESGALVTAAQLARGRDPQGIPWARLRRRRAGYRAERLERYPMQHADLPLPSPTLQAERTPAAAPAFPFFDFHRGLLSVRPTYFHPQLRHLLHAPSAVDVVTLCTDYTVQAVNLAAGPLPSVGTVEEEEARRSERMAAAEGGDPAAISAVRGALPPDPAFVPAPVPLHDFSQTNTALTSLLAPARWPLLFLGSMRGDLSVRNWRSGALLHRAQLTDSANAICNGITLAAPSTALPPLSDELASDGSLRPCPGAATARFFVSDNDCFARSFDLATMTALRDYHEDWPVNYSLASPDGRTLAVGGDSHAALLRDADSGQLLCTLRGHRDDIFSLAFHPTRPLLATGAQDHSARIFDLRRPDRPLIVLAAKMAPVRSVQFSHDGEFLAVAEGADFVHVVDMCASTGDSVSVQSIDLFGEVTGVAFSPDDAALFVAVTDAVYGGVMEYRRAAKRSPLIDLFFD